MSCCYKWDVLNYRSVIKYRRSQIFAEGVDTMATFVKILSAVVTASSGINISVPQELKC